MNFQTIGFIGLGLIGGSIAKKIKSIHPAVKIYAGARHKETIEEAYRNGLIENSAPFPLSGFRDCDCIFLCAPVQKNISCLRELKEIIKKDCIITDVGSTKTQIHEEIKALGLEKNFIGGHPMTGSEKTGIQNADAEILKDACYIITPCSETSEADLEDFRKFVQSLGSVPLVMDCKTHDYATAAVSHLPHMISYTLVNLVQNADNTQQTMKTIAAGGFKDLTRIASSSPEIWQNICMSNQSSILSLLDDYMGLLTVLRGYIDSGNEEALLDFFQKAKDYRDSM